MVKWFVLDLDYKQGEMRNPLDDFEPVILGVHNLP